MEMHSSNSDTQPDLHKDILSQNSSKISIEVGWALSKSRGVNSRVQIVTWGSIWQSKGIHTKTRRCRFIEQKRVVHGARIFSGGEADLPTLVQPPPEETKNKHCPPALRQPVAKSYLWGHLQAGSPAAEWVLCGVGMGAPQLLVSPRGVFRWETQSNRIVSYSPGTLTTCVHQCLQFLGNKEFSLKLQ